MSVTDFLDINIQEQDDDTQVFNLVKRVAASFKFSQTTWVPQAVVLPSLGQLVLPVMPILFVYVKNIGTLNIAVQTTPFVIPGGPPPPPSPLTLLGPGGIFLLSAPNLAGAGFVSGGIFPPQISGGLAFVELAASANVPTATGLAEYFLAG